MSEYHTTRLTAALFYKRQDPLNFKHLATTLNLILEPANIRFRVIHERPGVSAVLSCKKLHVCVSTSPAEQSAPYVQKVSGPQAAQLLTRLKDHTSTLNISVGTGPLPHGAEDDDRSAANLVPLLGQMVVNHMLNMNPTEALYWGDTDTVMTAKAFLDLIHAPMPEMDVIATPPAPKRQPARPALAPTVVDKVEVIEKRKQEAASRAPATAQLHPSMIHAHLISDDAEEEIELTDHIRQRFEGVKDGPKAAFIVSFATILVAPLIGVLLVIFNFMGGARLRQTAALAMVTALVTLTAELATQSDANATANAPQITAQPPHTAHL